MYDVTDLYKNKIQELDRVFEIEIRIEHEDGMLVLGDKDIALGSFQYMDGSQAGDEFTVGGTVASHIEFTLVNKEKYDNIKFIGARIVPTIKLLIREGADAHFIQSSQPSKMLGFDDQWEYIPLGQFNIDIADRKRTTILIKAIDNMINLDIPYSLSNLSYPANLFQIYTNICNVADVGIGSSNWTSSNIPNGDYIVQEKPVGDLTLRNVLGFVAELTGSFAKFNRDGNLELKWYKDSGVTLTKNERSSLEMGDFQAQVTGVSVETDEIIVNEDGEEENVIYLTGTDDYVIDLTGNELLQGNYENVLPGILTRIENTVFTPYSANFNGNPALESGDKIVHIDVDGNIFDTVITHMTYKYRGTSKIDGKALPNISRGFQSTDNRVAQIIKKVEKEVGDKLTTLEEQQLLATELIANTLGGYITEIKFEEHSDFDKFGKGLFIHNSPNLRDSVKIWKWGLGGFGYSDDGGLTYKTGITASGSIVAELVSANIITANMVNTGLLSSTDDSTWINLDDGTFNFKNVLKFEDGQLKIQSPDIPEPQEPVDLSGIEQDISNIKNLVPNTVGGGRTTIDSNGIKVTHTGLGGQYSEMRADGFVRKWQYGEAKYLNSIYTKSVEISPTYVGTFDKPSPTRVPIPIEFRGRGSTTNIVLINGGFRANMHPPTDRSHANLILEVVSEDFNSTSPHLYVNSYMETPFPYQGRPETMYREANFTLLLVGK